MYFDLLHDSRESGSRGFVPNHEEHMQWFKAFNMIAFV